MRKRKRKRGEQRRRTREIEVVDLYFKGKVNSLEKKNILAIKEKRIA